MKILTKKKYQQNKNGSKLIKILEKTPKKLLEKTVKHVLNLFIL